MGEVDWEKLREPFPANEIGKLPKGGIEIDFVGHAFVTARLNAYGGDWELIPGDPMFAGDDLVWMTATLVVGGVKRHDVGCADPRKQEWPKLLYSDAVSRCAMRHGVALALWQRETPDAPNRDVRSGGSQGRSTVSHGSSPVNTTPADATAMLEQLRGYVGRLDEAGKTRWEEWKVAENWEANRKASTLGSSGLLEDGLRFVAGVLAESGTEPFDTP